MGGNVRAGRRHSLQPREQGPGDRSWRFTRGVEASTRKNNEVTVRTDDEATVSYDRDACKASRSIGETERGFAEGIACK